MKKIGLRKTGGRNNRGRVTVRHRGGGAKRLLRTLEYSLDSHFSPLDGEIKCFEYDPNRTANVVLCSGFNGRKVFKLLSGPNGSTESEWIGKTLKSRKVSSIDIGEDICNVSLRKGTEGKLARAAGTKCKIIKKEGNTVVLRMPSGKIGAINGENMCNEGIIQGGPQERFNKAGDRRRLGQRPRVRGVAMNAVDHPLGGKTKSGPAYNKWGKLAKWVHTRNPRKIGIIKSFLIKNVCSISGSVLGFGFNRGGSSPSRHKWQ